MNPSQYEIYFDLSGSISKCGVGQEFVTVGGITLLPETTDALRKDLAGRPKWRDSDLANAEQVASLIKGQALIALTLRVFKEPDAWNSFWREGKKHYVLRAQAGEAIQVRYLKPESALQREIFGECSARLVGETVKRVGYPTLLSHEAH